MTVIKRDNMKNFFFSYLEKYEGKKSAVIPIMNRNLPDKYYFPLKAHDKIVQFHSTVPIHSVTLTMKRL